MLNVFLISSGVLPATPAHEVRAATSQQLGKETKSADSGLVPASTNKE